MPHDVLVPMQHALRVLEQVARPVLGDRVTLR
jgi:hypothetical protein